MTLILVSSAIVMLVGPLIARPLITLLGTPDTVADMAVSYLVIIFLGILGGGAYNIISGILRGMGDSFYPLVFLVVACLLNIALDLLFVCKFRMGVPGVAWATIIAQMVSGALCVIRLGAHEGYRSDYKKIADPRSAAHGEIVRLGLPSGLTQAVFSMASIVVQRLTNSFGEMIMAVSVVVMRVDGFAMLPNFTFGIALTTFVGQNVGAGRMDRVHEGVRSGLRAGLAIAAALVTMILLGGRPLMGLFTQTQAVVDTSMHMMKILAVGLYRNGDYAKSVGRHAWRGRYGDARCGFAGHNGCDSNAAGIPDRLSYALGSTAERHAGRIVYFASDRLDLRRSDYQHLL